MGVDRSPVPTGPGGEVAGLLRVCIDARDDHRPGGGACIPGGVVGADPVNGSIDGIQVHQRQGAHHVFGVGKVIFDGLIC